MAGCVWWPWSTSFRTPSTVAMRRRQDCSARTSSRSIVSVFGGYTPGCGRKTRTGCSPPGTRPSTATTRRLSRLCPTKLYRGQRSMPKYIIEREIPNAGALSSAELKAISQKSCGVLQQLGPSIQWVQSYVTEDKIRSEEQTYELQ